MRPALPLLVLSLAAPLLHAQDPPPTYQVEQEYKFQLKMDALARQEWTRDFFGGAPNQDRWRLQARPRAEASINWFRVGAGGEFNYSEDDNVIPRPLLQRDNYDSQDARLDLAFAAIETRWLRIEGGRFRMPVALTEMLWDRDLRPQGAALTLRSSGTEARFAFTAVGARGSHVFEDEGTEMLLLSAVLDLPSGQKTRLELTGSYLVFQDIETIEPMLRRQNTRVAGELTEEYRVLDGIVRLRNEGSVPTQFVADYSINTAVDESGSGLWLAATLGSLKQSRGRLEYVYASVDKDATLAAYPTDDFFWATGWAGHRGELAVRASERASLHGVGQLIRFKDSPRPEERDHWIRRFRVELRLDY